MKCLPPYRSFGTQINLKKLLFIGFFFLQVIAIAQPKKILFIGNSYVYTNNLPLVLYNLALSNGDTIIYDSSAPGGYTFEQHTTNATSLSKINAQNWDYVVLQQQSQMPSFSPSQVQTETYPFAAQLNDLILANDSCTETVFFMTWGRKYGDASNCAIYPPLCTFEGMQSRLRQSYVEMADDNQALVAPVGEAFKYARIADSTINLYISDNSHPSVAGTYLAACTFYATIFETSPVGLAYNAGLNATQALLLQQIAYQTVFDSLSVWNINEFEPQANFTYSPFGNVTNQFQFTSTSTNAISYYWLFDNLAFSPHPNPIYTFATPGIHTISLVVSNGCTFDTIIQEINISPAALQGLNNSNTPQVLQSSNQLEISNLHTSNTNNTIVIYNAIGEQIFNKTGLQNQSLSISTFSWEKGFYFIQIVNSNKTYTKKIIVP